MLYSFIYYTIRKSIKGGSCFELLSSSESHPSDAGLS
nr:MAG TPA: hypothetical protein [Caudoviricetes sp.]